MLLGPEFSIAQNPGAKACCCDMASCKGIGYMASLFAIPPDPTVLDKYLRNSGVMFANKKKEKDRKNPRNFKLAYWHFDAKHQYYN
jgi:hypothetical protein